MAKYLMFDHGGVLDGSRKKVASAEATVRARCKTLGYSTTADIELVVANIVYNRPSPDDFIYASLIDDDGDKAVQVLKNGRQIIEALNILTKKYGYKLVFHSSNKEADQAAQWDMIKRCCREHRIDCPTLTAMSVYDNQKYPDLSPTKPSIEQRQEYLVFGFGGTQPNDGKKDLRQAYVAGFPLVDKSESSNVDLNKSMVFDDGGSVCRAATAEGYQATRIINDPSDDILAGLMKLIVHEKALEAERLRQSAAAPADAAPADPAPTVHVKTPSATPAGFFKSAAAAIKTDNVKTEWDYLPRKFRQYVSEVTQDKRHQMLSGNPSGHPSSEEYWMSLNQGDKTRLKNDFKKVVDGLLLSESERAAFAELPYDYFSDDMRYSLSEGTQESRIALINKEGFYPTPGEYWDHYLRSEDKEMFIEIYYAQLITPDQKQPGNY